MKIPLSIAGKAVGSGSLRNAWCTIVCVLLLALLSSSGLLAQGVYLPPGSALSVGGGGITVPGSIYIDTGATVSVSTGTLTLSGNLDIATGATVVVQTGTMTLGGDLNIATGATVVVQTGTVALGGDLNMNGDFDPGTGTLEVNGAVGQSSGTTTALYSFVMNAPGGMVLMADMELSGTLSLLSGKMSIGNSSIVLGSSATVASVQPGSYVVTDSAGVFSAMVHSGSTFSYPVGTASIYAPLGVRNAGSPGRITVRVRPQAEPGTVLPVEWWLDAEHITNDLFIVVDYSAFGLSANGNHELLVRSSDSESYTVAGQAVAVDGNAVVFSVPAGTTADGAFFAIGVETLPKQVTVASVSPGSTVQSGEQATLTLQLRLSDGSPAFATTSTIVSVNIADPALVVLAGSTQAVIPAGAASTTLTLTLLNTAPADVTSAVTVQAHNVSLLPGTVALVVQHAVPGNFAATAGTGAVFTEWQAPGTQSIQSYRLYRGTDPGSLSFLREISAPSTAVHDSTVQNGTRYYYTLTTVIGGSESAPAPVVSSVPTLLTVLAPDGAENWQVGLTKTVQWSTVGVADSIRIDYSDDNGATWTTIAASVPDTGSYQWLVPDMPSVAGRMRITAAGNTALTDMSNAVFTVEAIAPPAQPTAIAGMQEVHLSWQASVSEAVTGYVVYRGETSGTLSPVAVLGPAAVSLVDTGLIDGTRYYYALTALVGGFSSPSSVEVSAVPSSLVLSAPNGGEQWQAGLSKTITWTTTGEVDSVRLVYSTDGGAQWEEMSTSVLNTGSYVWTVPNIPSTTALVRIADAGNPLITDTGNSVFAINELLPPSAPVAVSTVAGIVLSWNASASEGVDQYQIYHGLSSGSMTLLATVNAATGSYLHTSLTDGATHYYEVRTVAGGEVSRPSGQVWSIPTVLQLYALNGGEQLQAGVKHMVTWGLSGNINRMSFDYSLDNGATWQSVSETVIQSGLKNMMTYYFEWTVPNTPSTTALVRVRSIGALAAADQSEAVFTILSVVPPQHIGAVAANGGIDLTWTASPSVPVHSYRIYRGTSPGNISPVAVAVVPGTTLSWRDENATACTTYYYNVRTVVGATVSDASVATSATVMLAVAVDVQSPSAVTSWQAGTVQQLQWSVTSCVVSTDAALSYSIDGGNNWTTIGVVPNMGSYLWTVPNEPTTQAVIRIEVESTIGDSEVFTIRAIPAAGTVSATGGDSRVDLAWEASPAEGLTGYEVWRATTGEATLVAAVGSAETSYADEDADNCTLYRYTVIAKVGAMSSAPAPEATATPQVTPAIALTSPAGGESWQAGAVRTLGWSVTRCTAPAEVTLSYSTDGGTNWTTIGVVPNTGSYLWTVPDEPTTQAVIRVEFDGVGDNSSVFGIHSIPAAGALTATAGNSVDLAWAASPAEGITGYEILRRTMDGTPELLATTANVLAYIDETAAPCTEYGYTVRVLVGVMRSAPTTEATVTPQIAPAIALTNPAGGESWQAGTAHIVQWSATGCTIPAEVALSYSTDGGDNWTPIAIVSNTGSYLWTVPNQPTTQAVLRVQAEGTSDTGEFTLRAIPAPGAPTATAGDGYVDLVWEASSAEGLTGYDVLRATDGAPAVVATVGAADVSYSDENVDNCTSYTYTIVAKIDAMSSAPSEEATATPQITPTISLTAPAGGESWQAGVQRTLVWTGTGCTPADSVLLEYSTDNGATWQNIARVPNTGSYVWTVVNVPGNATRIRVSTGLAGHAGNTFAITPIPAPAALAAIGTDSEVQLSWNAPLAEGVTGYAVYRRMPEGTMSLVSALSSTSTTTADASVANCATYIYAVATLVGADTSALSEEVSAVPFAPDAVAVTAPAGGELWQAGTTHILAWTTAGCNSADSVRIDYSTDAGATWVSVATAANSGAYEWIVPNTPTDNARIRIWWDTTAQSSGAFAIAPIAPPTAVAAWGGTSRAIVRWTASVAEAVSGYAIYRGTTSGSLAFVGTVDAADTAYTDTGLTNTTTYFYAVKTLVGTFASGFSDEAFATPSEPMLVLTSPNGGEVLIEGATTTATWVSLGDVGDVTIEFSADGGNSWTLIATTANTGSYAWTIPGTPTALGLLRIHGADTVADASDAVFVVRAASSTAVNIRLMLEGATRDNAMTTALGGQELLPASQPYTGAPFGYNGAETRNSQITGIVDWLLLELRSGLDEATTVARRAVLLRSDGQIVDTNGYSEVLFDAGQVQPGSYYLVVRHRNHLDVMSASAVQIASGSSVQYDFTADAAQAYSTFQQALVPVPGGWAIPAGDIVHGGNVDAGDRVAVRNASGTLGYLAADVTMDGIVNAFDRVTVRNNVFMVSQVP